jgi:hypothetical protein
MFSPKDMCLSVELVMLIFKIFATELINISNLLINRRNSHFSTLRPFGKAIAHFSGVGPSLDWTDMRQ